MLRAAEAEPSFEIVHPWEPHVTGVELRQQSRFEMITEREPS